MATYPAGIPALPRPTGSTLMSADGYRGSQVIDGISDEVEAIAAELGTNPSGSESTVAARFTDVEGRVASLETAPATTNQVVYMDFTGPSEPTRPTVPAGTKVWWTGPFLPAAAAVGDKVDVTA